MMTLAEHLAQHRGSGMPRTRVVEGVTFHRVYRLSASYWIAEANDKQAYIVDRWNGRRGAETSQTWIVSIDRNYIKTGERAKLFRSEHTALTAAAKAMLGTDKPVRKITDLWNEDLDRRRR